MATVKVETVEPVESAVYGVLETIDEKTGATRGNLPAAIVLDRSPFVIGRYKDLECHLTSQAISGRHCVISRVEAPSAVAAGAFDVVLADTSSNGCYVNGHKLGRGHSATLRDGDEVALVVAAKHRPEYQSYNITLRFRARCTVPGVTPTAGPAALAAAMRTPNHVAVPVGAAADPSQRPLETAPQRESQLEGRAAEVNQSDIEDDDDNGDDHASSKALALGGSDADSSMLPARTRSVKARCISTSYDLDLEHPLGSGSFATVYRATHRRSGKIVAVKQINKKRFLLQQQANGEAEEDAKPMDAAAQEAAKKKHEKELIRHQREVEILLTVKHPHVVRCYEVYETDDRLWFVLSFAAGGELFQLLKSLGTVPETLARRIVTQLVHAVHYLHSIGIVHRDIKLENLLLYKPIGPMPSDQQSQEYRDWLDTVHVQVSDFGLSRSGIGRDRHLMTTMCGTPVYVAPEVTDVSLRIDGRTKGYTPAVDLFSVGVVAYALLTGRPPFPYAKDPRTGQRMKNRIDYAAVIQWPAGGPHPPPSPMARHCIESLLEVRPERRLSSIKCLSHLWLTGAGGTAPSVEYPTHVLGMKRERDDGGPGR